MAIFEPFHLDFWNEKKNIQVSFKLNRKKTIIYKKNLLWWVDHLLPLCIVDYNVEIGVEIEEIWMVRSQGELFWTHCWLQKLNRIESKQKREREKKEHQKINAERIESNRR